jgi:hypothetical protein
MSLTKVCAPNPIATPIIRFPPECIGRSNLLKSA